MHRRLRIEERAIKDANEARTELDRLRREGKLREQRMQGNKTATPAVPPELYTPPARDYRW
jgi:hypothetical protein